MRAPSSFHSTIAGEVEGGCDVGGGLRQHRLQRT